MTDGLNASCRFATGRLKARWLAAIAAALSEKLALEPGLKVSEVVAQSLDQLGLEEAAGATATLVDKADACLRQLGMEAPESASASAVSMADVPAVTRTDRPVAVLDSSGVHGRGGKDVAAEIGTVLRWNDKGFGFIQSDSGGADLFCHVRSLTNGADSLPPKARVRYLRRLDPRAGKDRAEEVAIIGGDDSVGGISGGGGDGGGGRSAGGGGRSAGGGSKHGDAQQCAHPYEQGLEVMYRKRWRNGIKISAAGQVTPSR